MLSFQDSQKLTICLGYIFAAVRELPDSNLKSDALCAINMINDVIVDNTPGLKKVVDSINKLSDSVMTEIMERVMGGETVKAVLADYGIDYQDGADCEDMVVEVMKEMVSEVERLDAEESKKSSKKKSPKKNAGKPTLPEIDDFQLGFQYADSLVVKANEKGLAYQYIHDRKLAAKAFRQLVKGVRFTHGGREAALDGFVAGFYCRQFGTTLADFAKENAQYFTDETTTRVLSDAVRTLKRN